MQSFYRRLAVCLVLSIVGICVLMGALQVLAQGETPPPKAPPLTTAVHRPKLPIRYLPPDERLLAEIARHKVGSRATPGEIEQAKREFLQTWAKTHPHGPDPNAFQARLQAEKQSLKAGKSVEELGLGVTGTFRLLAIAVEFAGEDTAEGFSHPTSLWASTCVTETVTYVGPLHNNIPGPGPRNNHTFWLPDFDHDYYDKILFTTDGLTERVRLDLKDPEDGQPGIDLRGQTVKHYYEEVSGGRMILDGGPRGVLGWVQVPHSEAYYGASACLNGAPGASGMEGLPSNPRFGFGAPTLVEDAVNRIKASDPTFPWRAYDTDGDGFIDNVIVIHAGKDKSEGGGAEGYQALWAHASTIDEAQGGLTVDDGGTPDPSDDLKIRSYVMFPEDAAPGVIIHELGHLLGIPDLYDTTYQGDTSVTAWDVMGYGLFPGKLFETHPVHMSAWSKVALGWATPLVMTPTATMTDVRLGRTANPPAGTSQVIQVNLPDARLDYTHLQPSSAQAWWSGTDQNWADVRLTRDIDLREVTGPISFTFQTDYIIEREWDFMFVEVSVDAGHTYTQTKGLRVGTGQEITTPDGYNDPTDSLRAFGGLRYGYTGNSNGWIGVYHDLTPYAGQQIKLRVRYATDIGTLERGAFLDNFKALAGSQVLFEDAVENGALAGWTPSVHSFSANAPLGEGWRLSDGGENGSRYYLLEWRSFEGFDKGLQYIYNTIFYILNAEGKPEWIVEHAPANLPGMVVWLRDGRFGKGLLGASQGHMSDLHFFAGPSEGPKAGLLLIDANPAPLRMNIAWLLNAGYGYVLFPPYSNWLPTVQATNAAFSLNSTPGVTLTYDMTGGAATTDFRPTYHAPLPPVTGFHDALGYYPGVEALPNPVITYSDTTTLRSQPYALSLPDASAVVPARSYYPPRTPPGFTGRGGEPGSALSANETFYFRGGQFADLNIGRAGGVNVVGQHSGNPGDDHLHYGHHFKVVEQAADGAWGMIRLWNNNEAAEVSGALQLSATNPYTIQVTAELVNTGGAYTLTLRSEFDSNVAEYVPESATDGAIAYQPPDQGRVASVGKVAYVPSGGRLRFNYTLRPRTGGVPLAVNQRALGPMSTPSPLDEQQLTLTLPGGRLYLPHILRRQTR